MLELNTLLKVPVSSWQLILTSYRGIRTARSRAASLSSGSDRPAIGSLVGVERWKVEVSEDAGLHTSTE